MESRAARHQEPWIPTGQRRGLRMCTAKASQEAGATALRSAMGKTLF